jgi:3-hydroxybutyryl-CoA dehydrogenase
MSRLERTSIVGVVGAGTMGAGIAHLAAGAGHRVLLYDVERQRAAGAVSAIAERLDAQVAKGRIDAGVREAIVERLTVADDIKAYAEAALVVEAIVESLDVKRQLFVSLEDTVALDAVLASNTSALSITAIASALAGLHFFNPPPVMPLVEVVSGVATDPAVARDAAALLQAWGKVPVNAASTPASS